MQPLTVHEIRQPLRRDLRAWQIAVIGLLLLSLQWNIVQTLLIKNLDKSRKETQAQLQQAEAARDRALERLEELFRETEQDQKARVEQAAACEAAAYQYIGECTITAYCPCAVCCGQWADGLTAAGIPAGPGIVAVDPEVIPLGSTVVIGGQRYLAADTGVTGLHVDVCMETHDEAAAFGVQRAAVWIETKQTEGERHGQITHGVPVGRLER